MKKNLLSAFAIITFGIFAISSGGSTTDTSSTDPQNETTATTEQTSKAESKEVENWEYSESVDKMEGTTRYFAMNTSTNQIDFDFPYNGGSNLNIVVRNMGKENEVLINISKGQFITSFSGSDKIKVKFDDNSPINYSYNSPSDGSMDVIFLNNSKDFLNKLKSSKEVMIECQFYDSGNKVFEFDTEGLEWDK